MLFVLFRKKAWEIASHKVSNYDCRVVETNLFKMTLQKKDLTTTQIESVCHTVRKTALYENGYSKEKG